MSRILIVEDEAIIRAALRRLLERHGHHVSEAGSVSEAQQHDLKAFDLVIADLRLPGPPGTEIMPLAQPAPVLIMTSYASVRSAVEAMKLGAIDYIAKPFDHDEMVLTVDRILKQDALRRHNETLKREISRNYPVAGMIGSSAVMRAVCDRVHRVAPTDATVLILGESGTGKELVARALHEQSPRRDAPIIPVNCAAIPEGLVESELFGHERGAFTGATDSHRGLIEAADGGTLFLDEIGELPQEAQARLLRVLQEGEIRRVGATLSRRVNVRLVAATHRDLKQLVSEGRFREDLYFRLHVFEITLPPLRERGDDIRELAAMMVEKICRRLNRSQLTLSPAAMDKLFGYRWPGNVRELENAIERAVILSDRDTLDAELFSFDRNESLPRQQSTSLDDYFIRFVRENEQALTETELARQLGISRKTLWERRQRLGIPRHKETP
ncbi:MAG TPA: sigma-54 dependent transcriptional regulator [Gammaproteobacteria bacterium]